MNKVLNRELTVNNFMKGDAVIYVPYHAHGDTTHQDCERGLVSSTNDKYVFVKFLPQLSRLGWEGTTSQACKVDQLVKEGL